ncbi:helix-turn-helix domain-containing protein [Streptomyces rapamycinicus]|uniref:DNA-binding protein n=2 Tax=Streptomyces rapamycinicus TaxID=1226757 RepID=A0A0A0NLW3_STRRN|nr:helix-turn-helix domain-containing protein [Streptomyces rapamycinicus]AGP57108.1 regulatory protein [Streptomyces rapamycinicus NRRL 5491]MBB4784743.1 tetratricopeptide (TPR) repeat protein [Streptomyces rapamycinicus]RLV79779.1 DNA-binding protein [Streptomyces rapamycinicus NRRL 5491]
MADRSAGDGRTAGTATGAAGAESTAEIGRRVLRLRTERGFTQRQLAEPAYTAAYVSTLEAGKVRPSEAALRHLADRLGVSYEELTTGRSPRDATRLRAAVTDARRALATGAAEDAALLFAEVRDEAERLGFAEERSAALLGLGDCALETGDLTVARDHFEAVERLLAGEPLPRRIPAIRGRAVAHLLAGELRYSCYLLESSIDELNASGLHDPYALLLLYTAAIAPYMDMGAHARAVRAAELALALAPSVDDPGLIARMHRGVARTLIAEGRTAEADASLAKAQELYEQLRIHTDLAHCHWMRGYVHAQDGNLERAERELRTARDMLASKRAALFTVQVEVELADVLRRRGRTAEAEALLLPLLTSSPAAGAANTAGEPDAAPGGAGTGMAGTGEAGAGDAGLTADRGAVHAGGAHRLLGLIADERGDAEAAEEHYCAALSLLERTGAAGDLADLCRLLGDLLRREGRQEAAMDAYRTGLGHRAAPGTTTLGPAPAEPPM